MTPPGVDVCDPSTGKCAEGAFTDTVSINGNAGGEVVGTGGLMTADMKFVYYADTDQMPVRRLIVQWGDTLASYSPGSEDDNSFANRRGENRCDDTSFGTSENACVDRPFAMTHTYTCAGPGMPACGSDGRPEPANLASGCWDATFAGPGGRVGACVYIPRVHVKDNWGFCTGRCPNTGGADAAAVARLDGDKCFDGAELTGNAAMRWNECGTTTQPINAWTYFQGRVIVQPP